MRTSAVCATVTVRVARAAGIGAPERVAIAPGTAGMTPVARSGGAGPGPSDPSGRMAAIVAVDRPL